jgi:hypothetical protein
LNSVKNGTLPGPETAAQAVPVKIPVIPVTNIPPSLPVSLKLGGLLLDGENRHAIINGLSFAAGETRRVLLQNRIVQVRCREIRRAEVVLELDDVTQPVILKIGAEKFMP